MRTSSGCRTTNESPSAISVRSGRRVSRGGGVSACRIRRTKKAESAKLTASAATSTGAATIRSSAPPTAGPATWATDWLACSFALPSTIWSPSTMAGR